jgi:hypothetical protein
MLAQVGGESAAAKVGLLQHAQQPRTARLLRIQKFQTHTPLISQESSIPLERNSKKARSVHQPQPCMAGGGRLVVLRVTGPIF